VNYFRTNDLIHEVFDKVSEQLKTFLRRCRREKRGVFFGA